MKATELMIGNFVNNNGKMMRVFEIKNDVIGFQKYGILNCSEILTPVKDITGTPLTEEWLVKFGFIPHYGVFNKNIQLETHGNTNRFMLVCDDGTVPAPFIDYVHSLQNLYFALTGDELTIIHN